MTVLTDGAEVSHENKTLVYPQSRFAGLFPLRPVSPYSQHLISLEKSISQGRKPAS
jgi:hypothetical protein